ncbi:MAG: glycolate oxidase subunit GlcF [Gammaproteobacteria bacterium]|nr:glycolate oxidase subunit GlcF [Gammaproteobacteria bacterium]
MQTFIIEDLKNTQAGKEANRILRSCVHCGFCIATCPTYRLLGDELDSPRGRIYLIKGMLEGRETTYKTQLHLDRCLTCRACETNCPSGVEYGHLLDIGRQHISSRVKRAPGDRLYRFLLRNLLPYRRRFSFLLSVGQFFRPVFPGILKKMIPLRTPALPITSGKHLHRMIIFAGCVQPSLAPNTNAATARVLDKLSISTISVDGEGCCGAIDYHMAEINEAGKFIRKNIDAWWPYINEDIEAIITTASGCGAMIKDYGYILRDDPDYADKARQISSMTKDISEIFTSRNIAQLKNKITQKNKILAFQNPCTLQHGQKLYSTTEEVLVQLGFNLSRVPDKDQCCGSAGVYSFLQPYLSLQLQKKKINALLSGQPDVIATSNIGCQLYLQQATDVPVKHWIELVDEASNY